MIDLRKQTKYALSKATRAISFEPAVDAFNIKDRKENHFYKEISAMVIGKGYTGGDETRRFACLRLYRRGRVGKLYMCLWLSANSQETLDGKEMYVSASASHSDIYGDLKSYLAAVVCQKAGLKLESDNNRIESDFESGVVNAEDLLGAIAYLTLKPEIASTIRFFSHHG